MNPLSTYFYARPSFIEGMARVLDFGNTLNYYNYSPTSEEADFIAIASDWRLVGGDMWFAIHQYCQQHPEVLADGRCDGQPAGRRDGQPVR